MATESKLPRDYWQENNLVFVHFGKQYALAPNLRTICLGPVTETTNEIELDATTQPLPMDGQSLKI